MPQIFRLGALGPNNSQGWQDSNAFPYNQQNRDSIQDPNGAAASKEITSIPSPFARIDLVKNAFRIVAENGVDGNTIYHKMVSDALDVGEIFFNIDKYQDLIEIITWDPNVMIPQLTSSDISGHRYLGQSLTTYLQRDKGYNFDKLQNIYLLNFKKGQAPLNIIGATSPATLFFSNSNDLSYVGNYITFGQDKPFDDDYQPLYKRDTEYIKAWFYMKNVAMQASFATDFPELDDYLNETFKKITDDNLKQQLLAPANSLVNVATLNITPATNVEVIGTLLLKKSVTYTTGTSDFEIASTVQGANAPLVLPVEAGNKYSLLTYTTDQWGTSNKASYYDDKVLGQRVLPNDGTPYPYLTIGDFLEDTIIKVPHPLNGKKFFDGNFKKSNDDASATYLLPLRDTFFNYFTVDDLENGLQNGAMPMIEMASAGQGVNVTLRIPIKGNGTIRFIEYSRIYYGGGAAVDRDKNEGAVVDLDFTGYLTPFVAFNSDNDAFYNIGCVSTFKRNYNFTFYKGANSVNASNACRNDKASYNYVWKVINYTIEHHNFDHIVVDDSQNNRGTLIPLFKELVQTEKFTFAVDLGTSNTHIEYTTNRNATPRPLAYDEDDSQLCRMFIHEYHLGQEVINDLREQEDTMEYDIMPKLLGGKSIFGFPTRTVLSHKSGVDWNNQLKPFELINIPFPYNKKKDRDYNESEDDLKWGSKNDSNRKMRAYIECLTLIMRNKVVMNGGNLSDTKITWFYPISMVPKRINDMQAAWDAMYNKYFGPGTTSKMTESIAPVRYFFQYYATAKNLVNIDIGGGTTDIAFSKDQDLKFVTSFRFASNDIFESGLDASMTNGIIDYFKPKFHDLLDSLESKELKDILDEIQKPSNVASFLFTLPDNPSTTKLDKSAIDFNRMLAANEDFKVVFILFYVAIIYHIAEILNLKGLSMPRHITFSGNGSKVLRVITNNTEQMAQFTKTIFKLMNVKDSDGQLEILGLDANSNPKQSTCKGALISNAPTYDDRDKIVIMKANGKDFITSDDTFDKIDQQYESNAAMAIGKFFRFALNDLNKEFDFDDNFGVKLESLNIAREVSSNLQDIETFLSRGLNKCKAEAQGKVTIGETLFFYPVKGVLDALSKAINKELTTNKTD